MNELALFAGAGGGILGGKLLGWRTVCAVELDPYCRRVLLARQRDGFLPRFPIWDNVTTFDGKPWRGRVDVVSGGFPCTDISSAGKKHGIKGRESGLWKEMARIIGEIRPRCAFVENSPMLTHRGLDRVAGDLAAMGYDARWGVVGAIHANAPHRRERIWIVAHATGEGVRGKERDFCKAQRRPGGALLQRVNGTGSSFAENASNSDCVRQLQPEGREQDERRWTCNGSWWLAEPELDRVAYGVARGVDRLKAIGNGQVPAVVRLAWHLLGGAR